MKAPDFDLLGVDGARHSPKSARGIGAIAVMPNDPGYVIDDTPDVARAYDAVCTPDFCGFDANLELRYHGRPEDLVEAMTDAPPPNPVNAIGCSIKWKK